LREYKCYIPPQDDLGSIVQISLRLVDEDQASATFQSLQGKTGNRDNFQRRTYYDQRITVTAGLLSLKPDTYRELLFE
jgi:hypothetical protein